MSVTLVMALLLGLAGYHSFFYDPKGWAVVTHAVTILGLATLAVVVYLCAPSVVP